jgi:hypothetical protein
MSRNRDEAIIRENLTRIKIAAKNNRIYFINRDKNLKTLVRFDLHVQDIVSICLTLKMSDYHRGPEKDHDGSDGEVWIFIHPFHRTRMYIKIKLFTVNAIDYLKIISFHD